jgi:hypothetical protein
MLHLYERFKLFYKRNDILFWSLGLIGVTHFLWWEIQQNKGFVRKEERVRKLGPFTIPYLDELTIFKKKINTNSKQQQENSESKGKE